MSPRLATTVLLLVLGPACAPARPPAGPPPPAAVAPAASATTPIADGEPCPPALEADAVDALWAAARRDDAAAFRRRVDPAILARVDAASADWFAVWRRDAQASARADFVVKTHMHGGACVLAEQ